jgi:hypothetical protein
MNHNLTVTFVGRNTSSPLSQVSAKRQLAWKGLMIVLTIASMSRSDLQLFAQANSAVHADSDDPEPLASTALPLTIVHAFAGGADLAYPNVPLVQGQDGLFYGVDWKHCVSRDRRRRRG